MASELAKIVVAAGVALVIGLAIGGIGPRAEVRALQTRVDAMKQVECGPSGLPAELAGVLQGRPWEEEGDRPPAPQPLPTPPENEPEADRNEPPSEGNDVHIELGADEPPMTPEEREDLAENLDAAREAMEIRNRQAWRALDEQVDPSPEQRVAIEDAVDAMNAELVHVAEALVASVQDGETPERRDMMVFAADALETMIATEDTIYDSLTPEQRAQVDEEVLDPTSYVDATVVDVLQAIEEM